MSLALRKKQPWTEFLSFSPADAHILTHTILPAGPFRERWVLTCPALGRKSNPGAVSSAVSVRERFLLGWAGN